ncbi:MAG: sulfotransferase [Candidatus Sphingomonas colombiensis]|nr:sulfotransferase [Sphingomonas sp.]WEK41844.1 MAG: sulfotransferase [Sphingomonas sp.]
MALNPIEPAARSALAILDIEARDGKSAADRLKILLASKLVPEDRIRALTLQGDAFDRQDLIDEAFQSYRAAQRCFVEAYRALLEPRADRPSHRAFIEKIREQVEKTTEISAPEGTDEIAASEAANHIFLLGYPRSGTTLVENILASAPGVIALEERDTFADIDEHLMRNDGVMPDLDRLDPALVTTLRKSYWARVNQMGGEVNGRTFVDMNPFNAIKLPIIARLFPRAKIIIMRRDPRDIVLSCFRINFTPGTAAWAFSDLIETARHYDAMMRLIDACRERLPLPFHELRYDRLVTDFENTVRALAEFTGLGWTDDFKSFDRTASRRGVRTASETQVRKGLYNGGGQWRRYERQLEPAFPILKPWISRFGSD